MKKIDELYKKHGRVVIHVTTNNRITELATLLQSLRTQSYQYFDLLLLDDGSQQLVFQHETVHKLLQQMKLEKHCVKLLRSEYRQGVCKARNQLIDEDTFDDCKLVLRLDDDSIVQMDYIERLVKVIDKNFDMSSGTVPTFGMPGTNRRNDKVKPIANELKFDDKGNLIQLGDDCGFDYWDDEIIPAHHLRSCFMYKKKITDGGIRYEMGITGFREETFFCVRCMLAGYKMAIDTKAESLHLMTGSGGCRPDYAVFNLDNEKFYKWIKEKWEDNPGFLEKYNKKVLK